MASVEFRICNIKSSSVYVCVMEFGIGIGIWNWKLELEIGIGNWNWKLELEIGKIGIRNWT